MTPASKIPCYGQARKSYISSDSEDISIISNPVSSISVTPTPLSDYPNYPSVRRHAYEPIIFQVPRMPNFGWNWQRFIMVMYVLDFTGSCVLNFADGFIQNDLIVFHIFIQENTVFRPIFF